MGSIYDVQIVNENWLFYYEVLSGCIKKINLANCSLESVIMIREKIKTEYTVGVVVGNYIYYVPNNKGNILKYNYLTNDVKEIFLPKIEGILCTSIILKGKTIIFVPFVKEMPFIKLDIENDKVDIWQDVSTKVQKCVNKTNLLFRNALIYGEKILLPAFRTNQLFEINICNGELKEHLIGMDGEYLISILKDEKNIYILATNNMPSIYVLGSDLKVKERVILAKEKNTVLLSMEDCGDYILIPQRENGLSYLFYKDTSVVEKVDLFENNEGLRGKAVTKARRINESTVLLVIKDIDSVFGFWNINDKKIEWMEVEGADLEVIRNNEFRFENNNCNLKTLIRSIKTVV